MSLWTRKARSWGLAPACPLSFADMLEVGRYLAQVPQLRDVWFRAFLDLAPDTVAVKTVNLVTHLNPGAYGHPLTGPEAEQLLLRAPEEGDRRSNMWLILLVYSPLEVVLHLLNRYEELGAGLRREPMPEYTDSALRRNQMLPRGREKWARRHGAEDGEWMSVNTWTEWLSRAARIRARVPGVLKPGWWRKLRLDLLTVDAHQRSMVAKALGTIGLDTGAWALFFEMLAVENTTRDEALETAAATL